MTDWPTVTEAAPIPQSARQYFVRMRDGVRLATDVYLPSGEGMFPAILVRLPYDKNSEYVFMDAVARRATQAGYALVVQDVRGKFRSEGEALGPVNEAHDGFDSISWIAAAEWSDGRVGMFGDSYYGFTQYAAVSSGHPALRAIVPRVTSTRLGDFGLVEGDGVKDIPWVTGAMYQRQCWSGRYLYGKVPDFTVRPLTSAFEETFGQTEPRSPWFDSLVPYTHPGRIFPDGDPLGARPVPTLHCVGWWDNLAIPHMRDVEAFEAVPGWAAVQHLWLDSTDHQGNHIDHAGAVDQDGHEVEDESFESMLDEYIEPALRFLDVYLKGVGSPQDIPRVHWHLAHAGYRNDESWPPPAAKTATLYLGGLEEMNSDAGVLGEDRPTEIEQGVLRFDPEHPLSSVTSNSFTYMVDYPDEHAAASRPDVAIFETEALSEDLDLAGPVYLWARVASTAVTADVFARLLDVGPDGSAHLIVRGQAEFTSPDEQTLRRIELGHTGYRVRAGHKLRLQLASSDFPEYALNPGNGENRWTATDFRPATHTLTTDAASPARLDLTVLP